MQRTELHDADAIIPAPLRCFTDSARLFDTSSSPQARVYYAAQDDGWYLKTAAAGSLAREATLTTFFHDRGLAAEVVYYGRLASPGSGEPTDWLVTRPVPGDDCLHPRYLADPKRLTDVLSSRLRMLHDMDPSGCPVPDRMSGYLATAARNHAAGRYDRSFFTTDYGDLDADAIYDIVRRDGGLLRADTLLHGDYCLPNVMLDDWRFSGFVDVDSGGVGDRHVDVYWALWSLRFNLHTDAYRERFLDGYGRDLVDEDILRLVAAVEVFG